MPQVEPGKAEIVRCVRSCLDFRQFGARRRIEARHTSRVPQGCLPKTSIFAPPGTPI